MKFLYYLAAIGKQNLYEKLCILKHNLLYIHNYLQDSFSIILNCYDSYLIIQTFMRQFPFLTNIHFHCKPGVLTELWLTNPHNKKIADYDYMLFILDDVKIEKMDIRDMIQCKQERKIQLLSPKIINSTHSYMNEYNSKLTITNALEVYCLLMTPKEFYNYSKVNTIENKWMWGIDYLFGQFKIKTAIYNKAVLHHQYKNSKERCKEAEALMQNYLKKYGYINLKQIIDKYPIVIRQVE